MWTAAGITAALLAILGAVAMGVRRRWPLPVALRRRGPGSPGSPESPASPEPPAAPEKPE